MNTKALPTKLFLHLSGTHEGADFTVFTADLRNEDGKSRMAEYPFVCEFTASYASGVTTESINAQLSEVRLGALYQECGNLQAKLNAKQEEIQKLLCIGHEAAPDIDKDVRWGEAAATVKMSQGPAHDLDPFDDDIPF